LSDNRRIFSKKKVNLGAKLEIAVHHFVLLAMTEGISNIEQGITNDEGRFRIKCGMTK